jgi:2-keto-4-pentenoate hydratase/2-oxohepta-3-ene-1,7-dioic acid hydratase in catechol pathway
MKLIRYGNLSAEKPGVLIDGKRYDTSKWFKDYDEAFFAGDGLNKLREQLKNTKELLPVPEDVRWASPLSRPSKIICIGLNYRDHALETNAPIPAEPIIFMKASTSMAGPNDDVIIPRNSFKTDWEVELAIVIGKYASYVDEKDVPEYIAGYTLHNDISEREFQLERGGTWDKGKGCNTFAPMGPFVATTDEIKDPNNLRLWLKVNGQTMQDGSTSNFIFNAAFVVSYVSQFMALLPGDVISTGTPKGVGMGMKPSPVYLKPGDVMELGIDGLGAARQAVVAYK